MNPISALLQAEHRLVAGGAAGAAAVAERIDGAAASLAMRASAAYHHFSSASFMPRPVEELAVSCLSLPPPY